MIILRFDYINKLNDMEKLQIVQELNGPLGKFVAYSHKKKIFLAIFPSWAEHEDVWNAIQSVQRDISLKDAGTYIIAGKEHFLSGYVRAFCKDVNYNEMRKFRGMIRRLDIGITPLPPQ